MKKTVSAIIILIILFGCQKQKEEKIVAQVNDVLLTETQMKANFSQQQWQDLSQDQKEKFIDDWVNLTVLAQEADNLGLTDDPYIRERINHAQNKVLANAVLSQAISEINLNEDDLFDYYKLHKSKYSKQVKQYKMQRIFVSDKSRLDEVLQKMRDGMKFTDAVKAYSEEALGKEGGYTGFLGSKDVESEIWNTVTSLKKWYYQSVKTKTGYYIVRWYESRTEKETQKFREVKDEIESIVFKEKKQELYNRILEDLKHNSKIIISI